MMKNRGQMISSDVSGCRGTWDEAWHRMQSVQLRRSWIVLMSVSVTLYVPSCASGLRGVNFLVPFFTVKFLDTSVTRSLIGGNARIGSTMTGSSRSREFRRVIHMSRGRPLTSAEHDPHLPALQFHRTARSGACSA